MKISIVIPVLNSHEVCVRQLRHFRRMRLPDSVEIIFVDDGSEPPLSFLRDYGLKNFTVFPTNDKRPWTQGLARNAGAKRAQGEYLMMTDIDHIFSLESIFTVLNFNGHRMNFTRQFGVLDKQGRVRQDKETLVEYGLDPEYFKTPRCRQYGLQIRSHGNTFAIKKDIFWDIGGYRPRYCTLMMHAPVRKGEDCYFNNDYEKGVIAGKYQTRAMGPHTYYFPLGRYNVNGDNNPMNLFHNLSYAPVRQPILP